MTDVHSNQCPKALDFEIKRLGDDKVENLCKYKGNVILVVNTASKCGFTPQYMGLERLYEKFKDQGFVVVGAPIMLGSSILSGRILNCVSKVVYQPLESNSCETDII